MFKTFLLNLHATQFVIFCILEVFSKRYKKITKIKGKRKETLRLINVKVIYKKQKERH